MRSTSGLVIIISLMLLVDFYIFQAVKTVSNPASAKAKIIFYAIFWCISLLSIMGLLVFVNTDAQFMGKKPRTYLFAIIMGLFLAKLCALVFLVIDDLRRAIQWLASRIFFRDTEAADFVGDKISRSAFLSWMGFAAGGTLFSSMVYGFSNKYKYQVKRVKLQFSNLPENFRGFKIVHISDIHSGSFTNKNAVGHGVDLIIQQQADIILFTGDLINDRADEMKEYMDTFSRLKAPMGVFSTLGNHDYGDYVQWPINGISKKQNLENLKAVHAQLGWRLLMNEHVVLEKNGQQIALLGIENWSSKARFPKHGRMDLAYAHTGKYPFKILMSHDPSHWDAEVIPYYSDIDLMLSGHTHGMQFGVEIPGFKWSPVQYIYKQWAGLYKNNKQMLYVNRGFGFIGYPGRVGILPEITVIEFT